MKRGEIWLASLDPRKGGEVGKQRPVLVLQTDLLNDVGHPTCLILPIGTKPQPENILRYAIAQNGLAKPNNHVLIDQLRAIDVAARFKRRLGEVNVQELREIGIRVKQVLDLAS